MAQAAQIAAVVDHLREVHDIEAQPAQVRTCTGPLGP